MSKKQIVVKYKKLNPEAVTPCLAHATDHGFDLTAVTRDGCANGLKYGCGLAFELPDGIHAEIRARSSVFKTGLILSNGVGTLDNGYRGEVFSVFYPVGSNCNPYVVGDRFAQLIFVGVDPRNIVFEEVDALADSDRGANGYGSTGK